MHLKSLELHGFKSFADKTNIQFGSGISVVVGPNGSGKSNVADAIRWVLGEQSVKMLRGSKMEDIIFAGTKKRRPLGMAEVSLTLDNNDGHLPVDYTEVTITRRSYRSGESEYLINNSICRLRDIYDLFVDTGIGKEAFSIIGQGRIDEILNSKPEERRSIIEEAAGIIKYRKRKKEANNKLQETEQSLQRINDIITEVSSQIKPLENQAEQARLYKKLKAELDELEINLAVHNLDEIKTKIDELAENLKSKNMEKIELETEYAQLDSLVEELKFNINGRDEEISKKQAEVYNISSEADRQEADIQLAEARMEAVSSQIRRLEDELKELDENLSDMSNDVSKEQQKRLELNEEINALKEKMTTHEGIHEEKNKEIVSLEKKIEKLKSDAFDIANNMANSRNEIKHNEQYLQNINRKIEKLEIQEGELKQFLTELNQKNDNVEKNILEYNVKRDGLEEENLSLDSQIEHISQVQKKLVTEEVSLRDDIQAKKSRYRVLKEMQQDYEGYYPGVKAVLVAKRKQNPACRDVVGVIAELVTVSEEYRVAVETALGGALQDIVTQTDRGAKEAIEFLKRTKAGRATFLPLNAINTFEIRNAFSKIVGVDGVIGQAAQVVSCESLVRPAVDFLLKKVIIVKDIETAINVARTLNYKYKIVTLEGDVVNPGGALTGGSQQKKANNLLSRIGEMDSLKKQLMELEEIQQELKKQIEDNQNDLAQLDTKKNKNLKELREFELVLVNFKRDWAQQKEAQENTENTLYTIEIEMMENVREKDVIEKKKNDLIIFLEKLEKEKNEHASEFSSLEQQLTNSKETQKQWYEHLTDIKVKLAEVTQEESSLLKTLQRLENEKRVLVSTIEEKNTQQGVLVRELANKEKQVEEAKKSLSALWKRNNEIEVDLNKKKNIRAEEQENYLSKEKELKTADKKFTILNQEVHQLEIKKARLDMEWQNYISRLEESFNLSYEQAFGFRKEIISKKDSTQRIKQLKIEIEDMGSVNLGAIDEFARMSERYQFLSSQQNDLLEARNAIYKVISEMDRIMIERFEETFNEVSKHFSITFTQLFGGGIAELRLTDPENLLETGIDLAVQPPGKKLQHLSLLSGGEKALTAISLLFAIINVRPTPFCVLDEIEAALDEANVERVGEYMAKFSAKTQFIAISHRHGTMEAADVLYGVTMEEDGVSKLISVKLSEVEKVS